MMHGSGFTVWAQHRLANDVTPMPDAKLLSLARNLRARAQDLAQAEIMENAEAQQTMCEIAASYERLVQRLEYEAGGANER